MASRQKRGAIEDGGNSIVHLPHHEPRLADIGVAAVGAAASLPLASAWERYEGAIDDADNRTDSDLAWWSQKIVTTL
jgi:hypothetical protein